MLTKDSGVAWQQSESHMSRINALNIVFREHHPKLSFLTLLNFKNNPDKFWAQVCLVRP